uniref:Secreted protein n=1 Tax=Rhizophora mucronata TaxID=61149 RepID=A0A2P2NI10_RHIMU
MSHGHQWAVCFTIFWSFLSSHLDNFRISHITNPTSLTLKLQISKSFEAARQNVTLQAPLIILCKSN